MKDSYSTLPTQGELSMLLSKMNCDAKFQNCLLQVIAPCAGQNLSPSAIAEKFKAVLEELMVDTTEGMRPYFRNRLCDVIGVVISQTDVADECKMVFAQLSS